MPSWPALPTPSTSAIASPPLRPSGSCSSARSIWPATSHGAGSTSTGWDRPRFWTGKRGLRLSVRIDLDWLGPAAPLALDLDARTNDLSLALVIEVEPGGRVLLFPGDAQAARWADWQQLRWPGLDRSRPPTTVNDLLGRTVRYKVGHHGAGGATPQPNGLDLMTHPDLVAMLPTDAGCAAAAGWSISDPDLIRRLLRATRGRLLRSDQHFPDRPEGVPVGEWEAFRGAVSFDPAALYIDFQFGF